VVTTKEKKKFGYLKTEPEIVFYYRSWDNIFSFWKRRRAFTEVPNCQR